MADLDSLLQRCRQGDAAAFAELFDRYQARVFGLCLTVLRDEQEAEDVVQDVFVRLFERIGAYRGDAAFSTWLTAVAVNRCRDRLRRRKLRRAFAVSRLWERPGPEDPAEVVARRQQSQGLWALVDRLDDKYRLPLILHYQSGLSCDEVGHVLGLRLNTVYSRLNRARMQLREMLQEQTEVRGEVTGYVAERSEPP
jgi:RNA polymerase sigma-70 factor (ECF subfamily)